MTKRKIEDEIQQFFEYGLDMANRTVYLGSDSQDDWGDETGVDFKMAEKLIKALHLLEASAPNGDKPINIIMNNIGGYIDHGFAIYDCIRSCKNHVTITVYGNACSMGCVILQSANTRVLSPNSVVMFHMGTVGYGDTHPEIVKRWIKYEDGQQKILEDILYNKILEKHPDYPREKFSRQMLFDTILTSEEAVELGLADQVL